MEPPRSLLDADQIATRVQEMGAEIREAYGEEPLLCIGILKGSFIFLADLMRAIGGDVRCGFLGVQSYAGTKSTGEVRITYDLREELRDQHVLIVEDIVDTGLTLSYLRKNLSVRSPRSLRIATLLDKPSRREVPVHADYVGFTIPNAFVVGYGLDFEERYRNLPYIGVLDG